MFAQHATQQSDCALPRHCRCTGTTHRRPSATAAASLWVPEHQDHRIASEEHFADEAILVHRLGLLLAPVRDLRPHLTHVLQDHVRVTVKCLDTCQNLPIVAAIDEHLRVVLHTLLQYRQGTYIEIVLLLRLVVGHGAGWRLFDNAGRWLLRTAGWPQVLRGRVWNG